MAEEGYDFTVEIKKLPYLKCFCIVGLESKIATIQIILRGLPTMLGNYRNEYVNKIKNLNNYCFNFSFDDC